MEMKYLLGLLLCVIAGVLAGTQAPITLLAVVISMAGVSIINL